MATLDYIWTASDAEIKKLVGKDSGDTRMLRLILSRRLNPLLLSELDKKILNVANFDELVMNIDPVDPVLGWNKVITALGYTSLSIIWNMPFQELVSLADQILMKPITINSY
jgi:hypothetical protein